MILIASFGEFLFLFHCHFFILFSFQKKKKKNPVELFLVLSCVALFLLHECSVGFEL